MISTKEMSTTEAEKLPHWILIETSFIFMVNKILNQDFSLQQIEHFEKISFGLKQARQKFYENSLDGLFSMRVYLEGRVHRKNIEQSFKVCFLNHAFRAS